jgi:hypothetical protein
MENASPADPNPPGITLVQLFYQLGICGPLFVLMTIILMIWLSILFFRARPQSDYFAFIAATLYPLLLGLAGSSMGLREFLHVLGSSGIAGPSAIWDFVEEALAPLSYGSLLTCLFFPLSVVVLLIRRPK